ncbi:MAG: phosphoadenylyl-sulfate reductase [Bacteroidetes bacterium]|nr:phosphoadenylyl-sulfate reductase [Bacteroidota bacterium]
MNKVQSEHLNNQLKDSSPEEVLNFFIKNYKNSIAFSTSFSAEDQVITHMISVIDKTVRIFTLDTGRHFQETYDILDITRNKYDLNIEVYFPDFNKVENMVNEKGVNLFYESIENRLLCCSIRKTEPLKRALHGVDVWVSGMRREQSPSRRNIQVVEWDDPNALIKVNPLVNRTYEQVWAYIRENHVPYHKLHDNGYPSIGCQPCTRAVKPGEDIRAGRWWWEMDGHRECGIHVPSPPSIR